MVYRDQNSSLGYFYQSGEPKGGHPGLGSYCQALVPAGRKKPALPQLGLPCAHLEKGVCTETHTFLQSDPGLALHPCILSFIVSVPGSSVALGHSHRTEPCGPFIASQPDSFTKQDHEVVGSYHSILFHVPETTLWCSLFCSSSSKCGTLLT